VIFIQCFIFRASIIYVIIYVDGPYEVHPVTRINLSKPLKKGSLIKTEQNAEYRLTAITCVPILKIKTPNKFAKVSIDRDRTEEFDVEQQYAVNTALTALKYIEDNHAEFKKISVQVDTERAETEVKNYVKSQNAGSAALTALKTAKKKTDEVIARDKFEKLDVLKQNADDDDTQRQHHHQEQARRI
jgi:hypothetical protein